MSGRGRIGGASAALQSLVSGAGNVVLAPSTGPAAAVANSALIQAALDAGGEVRVLGVGPIPFQPPLVLNWGNKLVLGNTTQMKSVRGSAPGPLVLTRAMKQWYDNGRAGYGITLAWTSGKLATVTLSGSQWLANGVTFSEGDYISIIAPANTTEEAFTGVFPVVDVPAGSPLSFTIGLINTPTVATGDAYTALKATTNFEVTGGIWNWDHKNNNPSPFTAVQGYDRHGFIMAHAEHFKAHRLTFINIWKFNVCVAAVRNFEVYDIHHGTPGNSIGTSENSAHGTSGDIVKIYGPAHDGEVKRISGFAWDDALSIQCIEPSLFASYIFSGGSIDNILVDAVTAWSQTLQRVSIYPAGSTYPVFKPWRMSNITVVNSAQNVSAQPAIQILGDSDTTDNYSSLVESLKLVNMKPGGRAGYMLQSGPNVHIKSLTFDGLTVDDVNAYGSGQDLFNWSFKVDVLRFVGGIVKGARSLVSLPATGRIGIATFLGMTTENVTALMMMAGGTAGEVNIEECLLQTFFEVQSAAIAGGGSGYVVGDFLALAGGAQERSAAVRVAGVSGGAITSVKVMDKGRYIVKPGNSVSLTTLSGVGTGATLTVTWSTPNASGGVGTIASGTLGLVNIKKCRNNAASSSLVQISNDQGATHINIEGSEVKSGQAVGVSSASSISVTATGNLVTDASLGFIRPYSAAVNIKLRGSGNKLVSGSWVVAPTGAPIVEFYGNDFAVDVGAAYMSKAVSGQYCFNNGSGRGTLTQNRLVSCNGTNWVQVDTPASVF